MVILGLGLISQVSPYVGIPLVIFGASWFLLRLRPIAKRLPRASVRRSEGIWTLEVRPAPSRDKALKALTALRKDLRELQDNPARSTWSERAAMLSVGRAESDIEADLARHAPEYAARWAELERYSIADMPKSHGELLERRVTQAIALLDDAIEELQNAR